jgi:hypothetical protein
MKGRQPDAGRPPNNYFFRQVGKILLGCRQLGYIQSMKTSCRRWPLCDDVVDHTMLGAQHNARLISHILKFNTGASEFWKSSLESRVESTSEVGEKEESYASASAGNLGSVVVSNNCLADRSTTNIKCFKDLHW